MPVNPGIEYQKAEEEYRKAGNISEKLKALRLMLEKVPKHKGSENLQQQIKSKISRLNAAVEKEKSRKTGSRLGIKKEGAASIAIVGTTNSKKSTLLNRLTGANIKVADYPFTTKKPEVGILDYSGIKIQIIEIPAIIKNFDETENGLMFLSIIRTMDLLILMFNSKEEEKLIKTELAGINIPTLTGGAGLNKEEIWIKLNLIKVFSKTPGGKITYPPIALKKGAVVKEFAKKIHKDFIKKFKYARVWGKSARFPGQTIGLKHHLADDDVVELHMK